MGAAKATFDFFSFFGGFVVGSVLRYGFDLTILATSLRRRRTAEREKSKFGAFRRERRRKVEISDLCSCFLPPLD